MKKALLLLMRDERGQDLIEYALLASLVAVGTGVMMPASILPVMSGIYARITSCMITAGG